MANKIKYTCKKCGWEGSIRAEWADLKPAKCPKCKLSFTKNPDSLLIEAPKELEQAAQEVLKEGDY